MRRILIKSSINLALAGMLCAQSGGRSGAVVRSTGWSPQRAIDEATEIVVGTLVTGTAVNDGSMVHVTGTLRPARIIRGNLAPGGDVVVRWDYQPIVFETPNQTMKVEPVFGLWMLDQPPGEDLYRPLPVTGVRTNSMGGVYIPLPQAAPAPPYLAPAGATPEAKLAGELGAGLDAIGGAFGDRLNPGSSQNLDRAVADARLQFSGLSKLLLAVKPAGSSGVLEQLAASSWPNLRTVGLDGLLRAGDRDAVFALERDVANLAPTLEAREFGMGFDPRAIADPDAVMALGRIALSEAAWPGIESAAAMWLGMSNIPQAMPYLGMLLESPNSSIRVAGVFSMCHAIQSAPRGNALSGLWKPEMAAECPNSTPLQNPAQEPDLVAYWKQWWQAEEPQLSQKAQLPDVRMPARYANASAPSGPSPVPSSMDVRLQFLITIGMHSLHPPQGIPPRPVPFARSLPPDDAAKLTQIIEDLNAQLQANKQAHDKVVNQARMEGRLPRREETAQFSANEKAILGAGLDRLQRELSPRGWELTEQFMKTMSSFTMPLTAPAKPVIR